MIEKEKEDVNVIIQIWPKLSTSCKRYLLGVGQGFVLAKESNENNTIYTQEETK